MDTIIITPRVRIEKILFKGDQETIKEGDTILGKSIEIRKIKNRDIEAILEMGFSIITHIKDNLYIVKNENKSILRLRTIF